MFSERINYSGSSMCDASGAAYASVCPNAFNNSATLLYTALFAVLFLFSAIIIGLINNAMGITLLGVIIGLVNILNIIKIKVK